MTALLLSLLFLQTPPTQNPTRITFTCLDHALDTGHEVDVIRVSDGAVVQTLLVGDPAADASGTVTVAFNSQPYAFGVYRGVVRAVFGTLKSPNSEISDAWDRVPGKPGKPSFGSGQ